MGHADTSFLGLCCCYYLIHAGLIAHTSLSRFIISTASLLVGTGLTHLVGTSYAVQWMRGCRSWGWELAREPRGHVRGVIELVEKADSPI